MLSKGIKRANLTLKQNAMRQARSPQIAMVTRRCIHRERVNWISIKEALNSPLDLRLYFESFLLQLLQTESMLEHTDECARCDCLFPTVSFPTWDRPVKRNIAPQGENNSFLSVLVQKLPSSWPMSTSWYNMNGTFGK